MIKFFGFISLIGYFFCFNAQAQILIGQTAGFTGGASASVKELAAGAQLYINSVNASGGVAGQQIRIIAMDDKFDPAITAENARILIEEKKVVALFLNRGTPNTEALLPLLAKHGIALVAPSTGAMLLHTPVNRYVFNVRTSYQREAEEAVAHLGSLNYQRVAVVHADDSFGLDALAGADSGFAKIKLKPVGVHKVDRMKPNYTVTIPAIVKSNAQAVLWFGNTAAVSAGIKALREAGSTATVITLSNNASEGFIKALGASPEGVMVMQVFPNERRGKFALIRQAQDLGKSGGIANITPSMLEGFAGAKVLVEGLRRAGKTLSREKILTGLDSISKFDVGGLEISYSPTDHSGLDFVELSMISKDGKFIR